MKKEVTVSTFQDGLMMDLNPLVTPNKVVTNCLNGTLLTYNGNEQVLQNDMGNGRVETAYLPEGYVPLGTAELGGIIYIVSYNPLIDKCQIGCFPSPERNISSKELHEPIHTIDNNFFVKEGKVINTILKVKLLPNINDEILKLNPGDKYIIYSNGGVDQNKEHLSDVGTGIHKVDNDPRKVTIHVISIGENGKITYLDDSLVWRGQNQYYIQDLETINEDSADNDIDNYRSLVSSAYNVFNSKLSGELALLFELKVINTFSVNWDADITGDDNNKKAIIKFNMNWTSSHPNINLKHAIITESRLSNVQSNLLEGYNCTFEISPKGEYGENNSKTRHNDGSDPEFTAEVATFEYNAESEQATWEYTLTPAMSFGQLPYLEQKGFINFLNLGSGKIEIDEWRYFVEDNGFYLNWGLSAYPEKGKKINKVIMTFLPFYITKEEIDVYIKTWNPNESEYQQYTIPDRTSYSGYFQEYFSFNTYKKDFLYLVDVCIDYNGEYRHNFKWLYTTGQWNDVFNENKEPNFMGLSLDNVVDIQTKWEVTDNIKTNTLKAKVEFPRTNVDINEVISSQITTVNFTEQNGLQHIVDLANVTGELSTNCVNNKLFRFVPQEQYNIKATNTYITHDEFIPESDRLSETVDHVKNQIAESTTSEGVSTVNFNPSVLQNDVNSLIKESYDDTKALDTFGVVFNNTDNTFQLAFMGAIFSRINADLERKQVRISQEIKPLLYNIDDLAKYGFDSSYNFKNNYVIKHGDDGNGQPFYFEFTNNGQEIVRTRKKTWNPHDEWSRPSLWEGDMKPYTEYLNPDMISSPGCFQVVAYELGKNGKNTKICSKSGDVGQSILTSQYNHQYNNLWVKTSEGHCVPINYFNDLKAQIAQFVMQLYSQMYYVDNNVSNREAPIVVNINQMNNYSETWNVDLEATLEVNILDNIIIAFEGNEVYLSDLCTLSDYLNIPKQNVYMNNINNLEFKKTISHTFNIKENKLYETFEQEKSTEIPAIALLSTEKSWVRCNPKNQHTLYVQNRNLTNVIEFIELNADTAKNITYNGRYTNSENNQLLLISGDKHLSYTNIFDCIEYNDKDIVFTENKLLKNPNMLCFETRDGGKTARGKIYNIPSIGIVSEYVAKMNSTEGIN